MYRKRQWIGRNQWTMVVRVGKAIFRLTAEAGAGIGVLSRQGPDGLWLNVTDEWDLRRSIVKRKRQADKASTVAMHIAPLESNVLSAFHPIVSHCAITQYDDGEPRKPGWVTIKTLGSSWVLEAKDPDSCSRLVVIQTTLDDALALLSVLLESEEAPWEPDPWLRSAAQKEAKKKK